MPTEFYLFIKNHSDAARTNYLIEKKHEIQKKMNQNL